MRLRFVALVVSLLAPACGDDGQGTPPDAGQTNQLVVATWNLAMFPHSADAPARIGETFDGLGIDVLAVEEVEDQAAFQDLAAAHGAMVALNPPETIGTGPLLGVMWRPEAVDITGVEARFVGDPSFPRPAVHATMTPAGGGTAIALVVVHLKAGVEAADEQERLDAVAKVDDLVTTELAGQEVLILGDFNEAAGDARSFEVFAPFLRDAGPYNFVTWPLAQTGAITFLPAAIMLDHMVLTPFSAEGDVTPEIPALDQQIPDYTATVSDHLPVVIHLNIP